MATQRKYNVVLSNWWRDEPIRVIENGGVTKKYGGKKDSYDQSKRKFYNE